MFASANSKRVNKASGIFPNFSGQDMYGTYTHYLSAIRMDKDKIKYILDYHSSLMTKEESKAWRHWSTTYKMEHSDSTPKQKESRIKVSLKTGWMTEDEKILRLLENGIDEFRKSVA